MPTPYDPYRMFWTMPRRPAAVSDESLRVSDAERHAVVDALSQHYADGRLDETEFNDRMSEAMSAKTRGDLAPLLTDLPRLNPDTKEPRRPPRRIAQLALLVGLVFVCAGMSVRIYRPDVPFLFLAVAVFVLTRRHHFHRTARQ